MAGFKKSQSEIGVVVIGRNEGERLVGCLNSLPSGVLIVYVDSGSTDRSIENARALNAAIVELDTTVPFTAARARNAGFDWLLANAPDVRFVQFVDGDCMIDASWVQAARETLDGDPTLSAVFGRRRERYPNATIYNYLCDLEWSTPAGEVKYFAGDVMVRVDALSDVGGYRNDMIAGEEPELSVRLRQMGWRILCLDREMTLHDAAMTKFSQWWKRTKRGGYAFALGNHLHGGPPEYHWRRETYRIWVWGLLLPAIIFVGFVLVHPLCLWLALAYLAQFLRLYVRHKNEEAAVMRSALLVTGKLPELLGQLQFHYDTMLGRTRRLIEYK